MSHEDHIGDVLGQWRRELPDLDRAAFSVVGRISRLALLLQNQLEAVFAIYGLTGGEFDVLAALRRTGRPYRMTPTDLSRALIVTSGGMTRRLHALEDRGLVRRALDPSDRRSTTVTLTPDGRRLVEEVLRQHTQNETRLVSGLPEGDRRQLAKLLRDLALSLDDTRPRPSRTSRRRARVSRRRRPSPPS